MYTLYVGSPNDTNELSDSAVKSVKSLVSKHFESYTYINARGVYQQDEEDVLIITIAEATQSEIDDLGEQLRRFLKQDAVAVEHNGVYEKLITK